jgi:hypothetical protein
MNIRWTFDRVADGRWRGSVLIPMHGPLFAGHQLVTAHALSPDLAEANHKPMTVVSQLLQNPLLAAMMPPGAPIAIETAKALLHGVRTGKVKEVLEQVPGHLLPAAHGMLAALKEHIPHLSGAVGYSTWGGY